MSDGRKLGDLVMPIASSGADSALAEVFREHLTAAGVDREALRIGTRTLGVDEITLRAGRDVVQTTMGDVKLAEDEQSELGDPFARLPACPLARLPEALVTVGPPNGPCGFRPS